MDPTNLVKKPSKRAVGLSDNTIDKVSSSVAFNRPEYCYVCHNEITKFKIYECELKWQCVSPDGTISSPHTVTPPKKKTRRETITQWMEDEIDTDNDDDDDGVPVEPAFRKNEEVLALLNSFNRGFKLALNGLEDLYSEAGEQAMVHQRAWQQQQLSDGIKELGMCDIEHILFMYRDNSVYDKMPSLRNGSFANLVNNLKDTGHFAIAFDVCTKAQPEGNYHVVVWHGKMHEIGEPTSYWLYGAEHEDESRNLK